MTALFILSPLILLSAGAAVWMARPVHAALMLALSLSLVAVLFLAQGAHFLGLVQFAVYVGAVAVLIVFSLLITRRRDEQEEIARRPRSLRTGLACALPLGAMLTYLALFHSNLKPVPWQPALALRDLGITLFTTHAPAVLALAVLLTAVMIGAALFAREPEKPKRTPPEK